MTQVSYIFGLIILIFLFPDRYPNDQSAKKEKEAKNFNPISVNLHLTPSTSIDSIGSIIYPQDEVNKVSDIIELPAESFVETPLQMESWMSNPKTWTNND